MDKATIAKLIPLEAVFETQPMLRKLNLTKNSS